MKKKVAIIGLVCVAILALFVPRAVRVYRSHVLLEWKRSAIPELEAFCADTNAIARELTELVADTEGRRDAEWFSSRLIRFPDGEWAAYANRSIRLDWRFPDIVITRGVDAKWYYTTLHFCPDMIELRMDGQPESLPAFRQKYLFREFSGSPEEDLPATWKKGMTWTDDGVHGRTYSSP